MAEYIEKQRVPVRVSLPAADPLDGYLSLALESPEHEVPETIFEVLNSSRQVIPFVRSDDQSVLLLTRVNIDWVMAGESVDRRLLFPPTFLVTREESVRVFFTDGRVLDGLIQLALTDDRNRTSDFLEGGQDFYALTTRLGTVFVNKARVRETRVFEPAPRPQRSATHKGGRARA